MLGRDDDLDHGGSYGLSVWPAVWVSVGSSMLSLCQTGHSCPDIDCIIGVESNGMQVDPHLAFLGSPRGQRFSPGGQAECCIVAPILPK